MGTSIKHKIAGILKTNNARTLIIKKNVLYSFLIKGTSSLIGFILIPLTINYINPVQNGIWLTVASLVAWINTFDIGLSNGLRNKLAKSLALNERDNIAKYISTTYALLFIIAIVIFSLFFVTGSFFNWNQLLRLPASSTYNIWPIILITIAFFCIQFILQPINSILIAAHQPFKSALIALMGQVITIATIYILTVYTTGSLLILVIVVSSAPVMASLLASIFLFFTSLKPFTPKFKFIDFTIAKSLLSLGGVFFVIQLGALVLYETDTIIIMRTLGPLAVTTFNIAYKYFSILIVVFNIILTPYWSAFTDAFAKKDFSWISQSLKKLRLIWLLIAVMAILFYFAANVFYKILIGNKIPMGNKIIVPGTLSLAIALYVLVQNWMIIHSYFLNGAGKLRIQLILVAGTGILNIPLSMFLIGYFGMAGTVMANIIVMVIMSIFLTYQSRLLLKNTATGIWNK